MSIILTTSKYDSYIIWQLNLSSSYFCYTKKHQQSQYRRAIIYEMLSYSSFCVSFLLILPSVFNISLYKHISVKFDMRVETFSFFFCLAISIIYRLRYIHHKKFESYENFSVYFIYLQNNNKKIITVNS